MLLIATLVFVVGITSSFGGSPCLPRNLIHPCICANVPAARNQVTTVVACQGIRNSDQLGAIFTSLRYTEIDKFLLYDSFWEADLLGDAGENQKVLPQNWMKLMKAKEMEIVDTPLSSEFACGDPCENTITTRLTIVNSTSFIGNSSLCPTGKGDFYDWTGRCMKNLTHLHISHGKLTSFGGFFRERVENLRILNLTRNSIAKIESIALKNLPNLWKLDLSHNAIQHLDGEFEGGIMMKLEFLDVSSNFIKTIGIKMFPFLPKLKHFNAESNRIVSLNKEVWTNLPDTLKVVNLNQNSLECGCHSIRWIKDRFPRNVTLLGRCTSPKNYENLSLRVAVNALNTKYDGNCKLKSKKIKTTVAA